MKIFGYIAKCTICGEEFARIKNTTPNSLFQRIGAAFDHHFLINHSEDDVPRAPFLVTTVITHEVVDQISPYSS